MREWLFSQKYYHQHKCKNCRNKSFCKRHGNIRLVHRDALDPCMCIFHWNNETLNIWTHLIGFFILTYLQYWTLLDALPSVQAPIIDYLVMTMAMLCCQICMLLSSAYHIFGCHSPTRRKQWLKADLFGVSAALVGLYMSGLYTSFYNFPEIRRFYGTLIGVLSITTSLFATFRYSERNTQKRIGLLELLYLSMALIAMAPTLHWIQLHGGLSNPHVQRWLPNLCVLFILLGGAFAFYTTLFPERLFPGKFDLIGCSHQWWHIFVLAAMVFWNWSGIQLLTFYHSTNNNDTTSIIYLNNIKNISNNSF
uniref:Progestin and adipoQ receptor family member 3 n=1 Tax=Meloidogyne hapla TaxID=6305 RepID=A0A1I8B6M9_MELHA